MAILSQSDIVVLDEPTSNLDIDGKHWYQELLGQLEASTILIIASNEADDMQICTEFIHIPDHAPSN